LPLTALRSSSPESDAGSAASAAKRHSGKGSDQKELLHHRGHPFKRL
jgi:hypothetical protein